MSAIGGPGAADVRIRMMADDAAFRASLKDIERDSFTAFGHAGRAVEAYTANLRKAVGAATMVIGSVAAIGAVVGTVAAAGVALHRVFTAQARETERVLKATQAAAPLVQQMRRDAGLIADAEARTADNRERATRAIQETIGNAGSREAERFERVARMLSEQGVRSDQRGIQSEMRAAFRATDEFGAGTIGALTLDSRTAAFGELHQAMRQALAAIEAQGALQRRIDAEAAQRLDLRMAAELEHAARIAALSGDDAVAERATEQAAMIRRTAAIALQAVTDEAGARNAMAMAQREHAAAMESIDRRAAEASDAEAQRALDAQRAIAQQRLDAERSVTEARVAGLAAAGNAEESARVAEQARHADRMRAIAELKAAGLIRSREAVEAEHRLHTATMRNIDREEARRRREMANRVQDTGHDFARQEAERRRLSGDRAGAERIEAVIESERRQREIQQSSIPMAERMALIAGERSLLSMRIAAIDASAAGAAGGASAGAGSMPSLASTAIGAGDIAPAAQLALGAASVSPQQAAAAAANQNTNATQTNTSTIRANTQALQNLVNQMRRGVTAILG